MSQDGTSTSLLDPQERRSAFGAALADLRQQRGYSQGKVGELLGVGQSAVSSWELGESEPTVDTVYALERVLQVSRPGTLSRHLGWLPLHVANSRRRGPALVTDAIEEDPRLDETVRRLMRALIKEAVQQQDSRRRR